MEGEPASRQGDGNVTCPVFNLSPFLIPSAAPSRGGDTFSCRIDDANWGNDIWTAKAAAPAPWGGYSAPCVAARAMRSPRYAGLGTYGAVWADGSPILQKGTEPVLRLNSNNFLDQFLLSRADVQDQPSWLDDEHTLCITRMRP